MGAYVGVRPQKNNEVLFKYKNAAQSHFWAEAKAMTRSCISVFSFLPKNAKKVTVLRKYLWINIGILILLYNWN